VGGHRNDGRACSRTQKSRAVTDASAILDGRFMRLGAKLNFQETST